MQNKCFIYILTGFLLFSLQAFSQNPVKSDQELIESLIEDIASNSDQELDYTTIYDDLNQFLSDPLNLNTATKEELEKLHVLNDFQINNLLGYIQKYGNLMTIYELQLVYGYNVEDIQKIMPFITVEVPRLNQKLNLKKALKYGSNQIFIRDYQVLEKQTGYTSISDSALYANPNSRYLGSPQRIYVKYKYSYKNRLFFGFTAEKDPGELLLKKNIPDTLLNLPFANKIHNGFDYYSFHLQINKVGFLKTIALGDFTAGFGQGLVFWSGMSYGKTPYVMNIKKKAEGIRKYASTDENLFMRGIGTTAQFGDFELSVFGSYKPIDANITSLDSADEEVLAVSSLLNTGYHTTPGEVDDKDAIKETIFGGNLTYNREKYKVGVTYVNYFFSADLNRNLSLYNKFEFNSDQNSNLGVNYQFVWKNINFFGETAMSENKGLATMNGAMLSISPQVSLSVLQRNYQKEYQAYYANAFGEATGASNEKGLFVGAEILPFSHWKISGYYDTYIFPWLKNGVDKPSYGKDYFVQVDYALSSNVQMYLKFKQETKPENGSLDVIGNKSLVDVTNTKLRYHISYQVSRSISMKDRVEFSNYKKGDDNSNGFVIYHDVNYKAPKIPLNLSFRYALFDVDTYDARIYTYETDVLYAFSVPALYSRGSKAYLMVKYTLSDGVDLWVRLARTYFADTNTISSGLTQIDGNTKTELRAQIRIQF